MAFHSMGTLLQSAAKRGRLQPVLDAGNILRSADAFLLQILPQEHQGGARAISYYRGVLTIGCTHSAAQHRIRQTEYDLKACLHSSFPTLRLMRVITQLMSLDQRE